MKINALLSVFVAIVLNLASIAAQETNVRVGCFTKDTLVETKNNGRVKISELSPGDYIKTYDQTSKKQTFSKFIEYLHYEPKEQVEYVKLRTESNVELEISEYHLIQRVSGQSYEYVFAKDLQLNDQIFVSAQDGGIQTSKIAQLETLVKVGAFAPLTEDGTLLANDVLASCFAHVISHELAQWFFLPIRLWDRYVDNDQIGSVNKEATYMSSYLEFLLELMRYPPFSFVFHN